MIRKPAILITGANGEIGHGLITALREQGDECIVGLDIDEIGPELRDLLVESVTANILDRKVLDHLGSRYEIAAIYHLAALLSTRAEFSPYIAHRVNVDGTLNLLSLAVEQARTQGRPVKFFFPSSIAVYGLPSREEKDRNGAIKEDRFLFPQTMYGCNKRYCELVGTYYARHYQQLAVEAGTLRVDFRALRFPGLISAKTTPAGGTTDYAPEMIHTAAVKGEPYDCFVREDTALPFMTMPDAIRATLQLMAAPREALSRLVYNVRAFNPTAARLRERVLADFPGAEISFAVDEKRQAVVDSWPSDVDDSAARRDWGWQPKHDFEKAFSDYLVPGIQVHYGI